MTYHVPVGDMRVAKLSGGVGSATEAHMRILVALLLVATVAVIGVMALAALVAVGTLVALMAAILAVVWFAVTFAVPLILAGCAIVLVRHTKRRRPLGGGGSVVATAPTPTPTSFQATAAEQRRYRVWHEHQMLRHFDEALDAGTRALRPVD
jgi:hypothetical protein